MAQKQRLRVRHVWAAPIDQLAFSLIYGVWQDRTKPNDKAARAAAYLAARAAWHATTKRWERQQSLDTNELATYLTCRQRGVTTNAKKSQFSCHHSFCPSCGYSRLSNIIRAHRAVLYGKLPLGYILWSGNVLVDIVADAVRASQQRAYPCREVRYVLRKAIKQLGGTGFHHSRMVYYKTPAGPVYTHRIYFVGTGLPTRDELIAEVQHNRLIGTKIHAKHNIPVEEALTGLQYSRFDLTLPYTEASAVDKWNKSWRTKSM